MKPNEILWASYQARRSIVAWTSQGSPSFPIATTEERVAGYFGMYDNDLDTAAAVDAKIRNGTRWEQYNLRIIKACNE